MKILIVYRIENISISLNSNDILLVLSSLVIISYIASALFDRFKQ